VRSICILDQKIKQPLNPSMELVKFQWNSYGPKDATCEQKYSMRVEYPHIFKNKIEILYVHVYRMH
jgi:hypothetical protein